MWRVAPGGPTVQRRGRGYFRTWRLPLAVVDQPDGGGAIIDVGASDSLRPVRLADAHCGDLRVATVYFKPGNNRTGRGPDYFIHETDRWLVFPHELNGLTRDEIARHKPVIARIIYEEGAA